MANNNEEDIQNKHKLYEEPMAENKKGLDRDARPNQIRKGDGAIRGKHGPRPIKTGKPQQQETTKRYLYE